MDFDAGSVITNTDIMVFMKGKRKRYQNMFLQITVDMDGLCEKVISYT